MFHRVERFIDGMCVFLRLPGDATSAVAAGMAGASRRRRLLLLLLLLLLWEAAASRWGRLLLLTRGIGAGRGGRRGAAATEPIARGGGRAGTLAKAPFALVATVSPPCCACVCACWWWCQLMSLMEQRTRASSTPAADVVSPKPMDSIAGGSRERPCTAAGAAKDD